MVKAFSESAIVKAFRALADQEKARREEQKADDKRWWPHPQIIPDPRQDRHVSGIALVSVETQGLRHA